MKKETFVRQKQKELEKYGERLRKQNRAYMQEVSAFAVNQRRSRAAALGECALQAMDHLRGLAKTKPLMNGSLEYMIREKKVEDPDGKKGFEYTVAYRVVSYEKAFTEEQITEELNKTWEKMQMEIDERFPEDEDGKDQGRD